jgi:hypothetical protein
VRAKNTALHRKLSRSALMPVGIAYPVSGHLIMTTPNLILPVLRLVSIAAEFQFAGRLDCSSLVRMELALQPIRAALLVDWVQVTFCRTLVTLCLIGSAVSVAAF